MKEAPRNLVLLKDKPVELSGTGEWRATDPETGIIVRSSSPFRAKEKLEGALEYFGDYKAGKDVSRYQNDPRLQD